MKYSEFHGLGSSNFASKEGVAPNLVTVHMVDFKAVDKLVFGVFGGVERNDFNFIVRIVD